MLVSTFVAALAVTGGAAAQSLTQALASQNASLSMLTSLLGTQPQIVQALNGANNVTILAPNNNALSRFLNSSATAAAVAADPGVVAAILFYHVLNGTYYASSFSTTAKFIPTLLNNQTYSNVTGGQVVEAAVALNGTVNIYSGLKNVANVVTANVNFTGGVIHVIDTVLTVPAKDSTTAIDSNLTALAGALTKANLVSTVDGLKDVTIFAPSNNAFNAISNVLANVSTQTLTSVLEYHVVAGKVGYSTLLSNTTLPTVGGGNVTITVANGNVFVNSAKVIVPDVLVSNGVVHVIDNVLNPGNATATPNSGAATQSPAFSGASSGTTGIPFTSGVPAAQTTAPVATAITATTTSTSTASNGASSSSSTAGAAPIQTAAIGIAALLGGGALLANL